MIAPNGLYWTVAIPESSVHIAADGKSATMEVLDHAVIDEPKFPMPGPLYQATISFHVEWTATAPQQDFSNPALHFAAKAYPAQARAWFKASVPSQNFTWASDPLETSTSSFAILGSEVNGSFYDQGVAPGQSAGLAQVPAQMPNTGGGGAATGGNGLVTLAAGGVLAGLAAVLARRSDVRRRAR